MLSLVVATEGCVAERGDVDRTHEQFQQEVHLQLKWEVRTLRQLVALLQLADGRHVPRVSVTDRREHRTQRVHSQQVQQVELVVIELVKEVILVNFAVVPPDLRVPNAAGDDGYVDQTCLERSVVQDLPLRVRFDHCLRCLHRRRPHCVLFIVPGALATVLFLKFLFLAAATVRHFLLYRAAYPLTGTHIVVSVVVEVHVWLLLRAVRPVGGRRRRLLLVWRCVPVSLKAVISLHQAALSQRQVVVQGEQGVLITEGGVVALARRQVRVWSLHFLKIFIIFC